MANSKANVGVVKCTKNQTTVSVNSNDSFAYQSNDLCDLDNSIDFVFEQIGSKLTGILKMASLNFRMVGGVLRLLGPTRASRQNGRRMLGKSTGQVTRHQLPT
jgi:hypothetical protein